MQLHCWEDLVFTQQVNLVGREQLLKIGPGDKDPISTCRQSDRESGESPCTQLASSMAVHIRSIFLSLAFLYHCPGLSCSRQLSLHDALCNHINPTLHSTPDDNCVGLRTLSPCLNCNRSGIVTQACYYALANSGWFYRSSMVWPRQLGKANRAMDESQMTDQVGVTQSR